MVAYVNKPNIIFAKLSKTDENYSTLSFFQLYEITEVEKIISGIVQHVSKLRCSYVIKSDDQSAEKAEWPD